MNTVSELQIVEEATYLIKKVIYSQKEDAVSSPFRTDSQKQLREKGAQQGRGGSQSSPVLSPPAASPCFTQACCGMNEENLIWPVSVVPVWQIQMQAAGSAV